MIYNLVIKRLFDILLSLFALVIAFPILIFVFFLIAFINNTNPIFTQSRPGRNKIIFKVIKFKTMNDKRDTKGNQLPDAERLTPIGKFVRKTSCDELPQLINVLKGDMSLIGPRPLLIEYIPLYNKTQKRRHEVRPGITGWAQVNGRNTISWKKKFEYDVWYVDNISFTTDINILYLTFKKVFISEGINQQGQVTAEKFNGKN